MENELFDNGKCYRPDEVAITLGVSRRAIYRLAQAGDIAAFKVKSCTRITGKSINAYLEKNKIDPYGTFDARN